MMSTLWQYWYNAFFKPQSALSIAVFRICLGVLVLLNSVISFPELFVWFGEKGWLQMPPQTPYQFDLFRLLPPTDGNVQVVFWVVTIGAIGLTLGLLSRFSAFLVWIGLLSLQNLNPFACNAADGLMRICAFYLMFSPAGKALSLDNWIKRRRSGDSASAGEALYSPWAQRMLQIQVAAIYWQASWGKSGHTWMEGTAIYYVMNLHQYARFQIPFSPDYIWVSKLLTWSTLAIEFCLWSLVWIKKIRYPILAAGVLLHLGIDITMNVPLFGYLMIASYLLFVDPNDLRALATRLRNTRTF